MKIIEIEQIDIENELEIIELENEKEEIEIIEEIEDINLKPEIDKEELREEIKSIITPMIPKNGKGGKNPSKKELKELLKETENDILDKVIERIPETPEIDIGEDRGGQYIKKDGKKMYIRNNGINGIPLAGGSTDTLQSVTDRGATTTNIITVPGVQFDTTATPATNAEGLLQWNATDGTLDLGMSGGNITQQIGQEMFIKVRNASGATIPNGTPVYFNGRQGNRPKIYLSQSDVEASGRTRGLTTEDIADNADGFITTFGYVRHIKTDYTGTGDWGTTWVEGDNLYVSKTVAGQLTNVEPSAPHHSCILGQVGIVGNVGVGSIFVDIEQHKTLEELSDVNGTALTTDGQFPVWNNTSGFFDFNYNITDYALAADYVPYTGATTTLDMGSQSIKVQYLLDQSTPELNSIGVNDRILYDNTGTQNVDYSTPGNLSIYNNTSGTATLFFPGIGSGFYLEGSTSSNAVGVGNIDYFYFNSRLEAYAGIVSNSILVNETSPYDNSCVFEAYGKGGFWDASNNLAYFATGTEAGYFSNSGGSSIVKIIDNNNGSCLNWDVPSFWGGTLSGSGGAIYAYDTVNNLYICDGTYAFQAFGNAGFRNAIQMTWDGSSAYYFTIQDAIMYDPSGESMNWSARTLSRQGAVLSIDYQNGKAYASDGTSEMFDYNTAGVVNFSINDIEITDSSKGVILQSPDTTRWRLQIDNSGTLTVTSL